LIISTLTRSVIHSQIRGDFAELFEGGFEVFDLCENIRIGKIVGFLEARLVAGEKPACPISSPQRFFGSRCKYHTLPCTDRFNVRQEASKK
jgi:hypothetical protein